MKVSSKGWRQKFVIDENWQGHGIAVDVFNMLMWLKNKFIAHQCTACQHIRHRLSSACLYRYVGFCKKKWVRLAQNETYLGLFQIRFQYILGQTVLKSNLKKSQICLIWGQSDPFRPKFDIPVSVIAYWLLEGQIRNI